MLWVLKRTVSMRQFFWAPKHVLKIMGKKIFTILRWKYQIPGIQNKSKTSLKAEHVTCLKLTFCVRIWKPLKFCIKPYQMKKSRKYPAGTLCWLYIDSMLIQHHDVESALNQCWANNVCLLGIYTCNGIISDSLSQACHSFMFSITSVSYCMVCIFKGN